MKSELNYKGVEITVDANGQFTATRDGVELFADTFEKIKQQIDREVNQAAKKTKLELGVVGILKPDGWKVKIAPRVAQAVLIGVNRNTSKLQLDGLPADTRLDSVLPLTQENIALLEKLLAVSAEYERVAGEVTARELEDSVGYGRIQPEEYNRKLQKVRDDYARKLRKTKNA